MDTAGQRFSLLLSAAHTLRTHVGRAPHIWPGPGKHLVIFVSGLLNSSPGYGLSLCVLNLLQLQELPAAPLRLRGQTFWGRGGGGDFPQNRCCPKIPRSYGNKPTKRESDTATSGEHELTGKPLGSLFLLFFNFHPQNRQKEVKEFKRQNLSADSQVKTDRNLEGVFVFSCR